MRSRLIVVILLFGLAMTVAGPGRAEPTVPAGFQVETIANLRAVDMAFGPGGAFGTDLYVTTGTEVLRIGSGGSVTTFATGLSQATGLAFGSGAFGDYLYVAQNDGVLRRIDAGGGVSGDFASGLNNAVEIAFGPGSDGFSTDLYVADGGFLGGVPGRILRVDSAGSVSTFASDNDSTSIGLTFISGGDVGGTRLILADALNFGADDGSVRSYSSDGAFATMISAGPSGLFDPGRVVRGPGGLFGTDLFVTDFNASQLSTLSLTGTLTPFASNFTLNDFRDGDIRFSPDGNSLLLATADNGGTIYRISVVPGPTSVVSLGVGALICLGCCSRRRMRARVGAFEAASA